MGGQGGCGGMMVGLGEMSWMMMMLEIVELSCVGLT